MAGKPSRQKHLQGMLPLPSDLHFLHSRNPDGVGDRAFIAGLIGKGPLTHRATPEPPIRFTAIFVTRASTSASETSARSLG